MNFSQTNVSNLHFPPKLSMTLFALRPRWRSAQGGAKSAGELQHGVHNDSPGKSRRSKNTSSLGLRHQLTDHDRNLLAVFPSRQEKDSQQQNSVRMSEHGLQCALCKKPQPSHQSTTSLFRYHIQSEEDIMKLLCVLVAAKELHDIFFQVALSTSPSALCLWAVNRGARLHR